MTKRLKIYCIFSILGLILFIGIFFLVKSSRSFEVVNENALPPEVFTAQVNTPIEEEEEAVEEVEEDLEVRAKAILSVKVDINGKEEILYEKNPDSPLPIASITKLMTALIVFDLDIDMSQMIILTEEAVNQEGISKLRAGDQYSVETLLNIMLVESNNDIAYALTSLTSQEEFIKLMNDYSDKIGLENANFVNSTGLEPEIPGTARNIASSQDIVKLVKYIYNNYPRIFKITSQKTYKVASDFISENTNVLLWEYTGVIGGKTGWNPVAKGCLVLILDDPLTNNYYINVILGADDRFKEMRKLIKTTYQR